MKHFCKQASKLASDAFERDLTFIERARFRFHLAICEMCRNYATSLAFLHKIFSGMREKEDYELCLSDKQRNQIELALKQITHDKD